MSAPSSFPRSLLIGGALLGLLGLILWFTLPLRLAFPPYLFTASLAILYGGFEARRLRPSRAKKSDPSP